MLLRCLLLACLLAGVTVLSPLAAAGGGSWLYPLEERYDPGEEAVLEGQVSLAGLLGSIEDGPFYAYLRVDPATDRRASKQAALDTWPYIDPTDLPLGQIEIMDSSNSNAVAGIEFVVPDIEPGQYDIVYCNDPCTDGLGDLIGGVISIGQDPPYPLTQAGQAAAAEAGRVPPGAFPGLGADPTAVTTTQTVDTSVDRDEQARVEPATDQLDSSVPVERRPEATTAGLHWGWYVTLAAVGSAAIAMSAVNARRRHGTPTPASSVTEPFVDLGEIETEAEVMTSAVRER